MSDENRGEKSSDIVLMGPETPAGTAVLRKREGRVEVGVIQEVEDGKPLNGSELLHLQSTEHHGVYEVTASYKPETEARTKSESSGPAMVNSQKFRDGWDYAFGPKDSSNLN